MGAPQAGKGHETKGDGRVSAPLQVGRQHGRGPRGRPSRLAPDEGVVGLARPLPVVRIGLGAATDERRPVRRPAVVLPIAAHPAAVGGPEDHGGVVGDRLEGLDAQDPVALLEQPVAEGVDLAEQHQLRPGALGLLGDPEGDQSQLLAVLVVLQQAHHGVVEPGAAERQEHAADALTALGQVRPGVGRQRSGAGDPGVGDGRDPLDQVVVDLRGAPGQVRRGAGLEDDDGQGGLGRHVRRGGRHDLRVVGVGHDQVAGGQPQGQRRGGGGDDLADEGAAVGERDPPDLRGTRRGGETRHQRRRDQEPRHRCHRASGWPPRPTRPTRARLFPR